MLLVVDVLVFGIFIAINMCLFLVLHTAILEPNFDLLLTQTECDSQLYPTPSG